MRKWGIFKERKPHVRVKSGFCEAEVFDFLRKWGIYEEKKLDCRVKLRICEEKMSDFRVNGGFSMRKSLIVGLNRGFVKRKCLIFA